MDKIKRLGDAELEIMQIIWARPKPMTSNEILKKLKQRQWKLSTLMTALNRLAEKEYLVCDRTTRTNFYSALISEDSYKEHENKLFLEKLYGSSLQNFVACLCDSNSISKKDVAELRDYLKNFT